MNEKLDEYLKQKLAEGKASSTIASRRRILRSIIEYFRQKEKFNPADITPQDFDNYFMTLHRAGIRESTRRARATVIRGFFRWLTENGRVIVDVTQDLSVSADEEEPLLIAPLEESDVAQLIESLPRTTAIDLRNRAQIELLYSCGLRIDESLSLDVRDVDLQENILYVRHGKGSKARTLPLMRGVAAALRDYLDVRRSLLMGPDSGALLLNQFGQRLKQRTFRLWLRRLNRARGDAARHIYPHLLRHSIAVHLLRAGADIRYIQEFLGHTRLNTTKLYLRLVPERLKEDYEKAMPDIDII